jgi:hypothetical protein
LRDDLVEAEQAETASEPAEMRIRSESRLARRRGPDSRDRCDVKRFEHWVDRNPIAIAERVGQRR